MASYRALPSALSKVSPQFSTPVVASVLTGVLLIAIGWIYLLATSVHGAFSDLINDAGIFYIAFYVLSALATIVYYRRRIFTSTQNALVLGVLPFGAAGFLVWIVVRSIQGAPAAWNWALVITAVAGVIMLVVARFVLKSSFFQIPRESDPGH
jgi:amino acid transporter